MNSNEAVKIKDITIQRSIAKKPLSKLVWNSKSYLSNPKEGRKEKQLIVII